MSLFLYPTPLFSSNRWCRETPQSFTFFCFSKNTTVVICFCHLTLLLLLWSKNTRQWLIQQRPCECVFLYETQTMWSRQKKGSCAAAVGIEHIGTSPLKSFFLTFSISSEHLSSLKQLTQSLVNKYFTQLDWNCWGNSLLIIYFP